MSAPRIDPASFRDPKSRVFHHRGRICRGLNPGALADWLAFSTTRLFAAAQASRQIVPTRELELDDSVLQQLSPHWVAALEHERLPFVSYPYEWPFSMLQDAALLQLELLEGALGEQLILKDSSPYNVQWIGAAPVFMDVASFERYVPGEAWIGYLQFCQLFLYPLLLTAYKDVPFQPWLRGALDGITPADCRALMSWRDFLRPGVLTHVALQAHFQDRAQDLRTSLRRDLGRSGFSPALILANVRRLRRLVTGLRWRRESSTWSGYATEHSYSAADDQAKRDFVATATSARRPRLVWDLGCNTGTYARLAAEDAEYVVAMDSDHLAVDRLYRELKREGNSKILPLLNNLADPSPALGFRAAERATLAERGRPDMVLCLALIHHLALTANLPLADLLAWLAGLGGHLVIEFVTKQDPMVQRLLLNKEDLFDDYEPVHFERCLSSHFEVITRLELSRGTRTLYHASPRGL